MLGSVTVSLIPLLLQLSPTKHQLFINLVRLPCLFSCHEHCQVPFHCLPSPLQYPLHIQRRRNLSVSSNGIQTSPLACFYRLAQSPSQDDLNTQAVKRSKTEKEWEGKAGKERRQLE
jgi:hypothetical protein